MSPALLIVFFPNLDQRNLRNLRLSRFDLLALENWRTLFKKCLDRFAMVLGAASHRLAPRLTIEQFLELVSDRGVEIRLHIRVGNRRSVRDSRRDRMHFVAKRR